MPLSRYAVRGVSAPRLDPALEAFLVRQRELARHTCDRLVARYQRRVQELSPHVETRGLPQPCDLEYRRTHRGIVEEYEF